LKYKILNTYLYSTFIADIYPRVEAMEKLIDATLKHLKTRVLTKSGVKDAREKFSEILGTNITARV